MSRKRVREDLVHLLGETCAYCEGKGYTKSLRTIIYEILEELRHVPVGSRQPGKDRKVVLYVHPDVQVALQEEERDFLVAVEKKINRQVIVKSDPLSHIEEFSVIAP